MLLQKPHIAVALYLCKEPVTTTKIGSVIKHRQTKASNQFGLEQKMPHRSQYSQNQFFLMTLQPKIQEQQQQQQQQQLK